MLVESLSLRLERSSDDDTGIICLRAESRADISASRHASAPANQISGPPPYILMRVSIGPLFVLLGSVGRQKGSETSELRVGAERHQHV